MYLKCLQIIQHKHFSLVVFVDSVVETCQVDFLDMFHVEGVLQECQMTKNILVWHLE